MSGAASPLFDGPIPISGMLATALLVLPWLNPIAIGPTPSIMPQLVSLACGAMFLLIYLARPGYLGALFANALLVAALVSSVIALLQYLGASPALAPWVSVTAPGYAFGNLRQRNQLGSLLNIGMAVLVWSAWTQQLRCAINVRQNLSGSIRWRLPVVGKHCALQMLAVVLLASASAATTSRTGLVQMVALLVLALVWRRQRAPGTWVILGGAVLAYVIASVLLPILAGLDPFVSGIAGRISEGAQACQSRIILWSNVLHLIAQNPWFGWGWGELDYAHFVTVYPGERFCDILDNAHNLPLHLAVELGTPVAVFVCGLVAWLIWRVRPWHEADADRQMAWAVLAVIGLHSMLEYPLWYGPFQIAVVLAIWILWRAPDVPLVSDEGNISGMPCCPRPRSSRSAFGVKWVTALAFVVLVAVAYAAWDYWRVSQIYRTPAQRAPAYRDDTLAKISDSYLFRNQVRFAALTLTRVTPANAQSINQAAHDLLHFSPEARVVNKLIDSALILDRQEEAALYMRRYRIAYPKDYARWRAAHDPATPLPSIDP